MRLPSERVRALASAGVGELVAVEHVLFDVVRSRCAAAGIVAGDVLEVTAWTRNYVRVRTPRGTTARLERALTQFVGVVSSSCRTIQSELPLSLPTHEEAARRSPAVAAA